MALKMYVTKWKKYAASGECFQNITYQLEYKVWSLQIWSGIVQNHFLNKRNVQKKFQHG